MLNLAGARGREDQLQGTDRSSSVHARSLASQVLLLLLDLLWLAIGHMQGNAGQEGPRAASLRRHGPGRRRHLAGDALVVVLLNVGLEIAAQLRANVDGLETFIGRVEDAHTIGEI